jgi:RNA polymerase sigma-70 factor (ECF subfamily)
VTDVTTTDAELIRRIAAGDIKAFERLFHLYHGALCDFIARQVDSPATAADIAQDLFFTLWQRRAEIQLTSTLRGYLFGAARKGALNWSRHSIVARRLGARPWPNTQPPGAGELPMTADVALELKESAAALQRQLANLPERTQLALRLRWERQLSYAEVADVMDISVKGVEKLLANGMKALRRAMAVGGRGGGKDE